MDLPLQDTTQSKTTAQFSLTIVCVLAWLLDCRDYLRGDMRPSVHVRAHTIRGRLLCRLGGHRRQEAAVSFESAANTANQVRDA